MRIDSHQHFWEYDPEEYPWIQPGSKLERSYLPIDLFPELKQNRMDGCIAVQARQALIENDFLFELASKNAFIKGVVGWIDLQSESVCDEAAKFASENKGVGIRHVVQDETDPNFMKRPAFRRGIASLAEHDLVYDILIYWYQLEDAIDLVRSFPNQPFVVDHLAKPAIAKHETQPWRDHIASLAKFPNVSCKVSGMITEADHSQWQAADLQPYLEVVFEAFGPSRILFGSDWPVIRLAGEYSQFTQLIDDFIKPLSSNEQVAIMGQNAVRIYRLSL